MRKIIHILFIIILVSGCSVTRREKSDKTEPVIAGKSGNLAERVKDENITKSNFFIKRADVEIKTDAGKNRFICTVKFKEQGNYLVSFKNVTGIEIVRMFLSEDSVFINDRINRKLYQGSSRYLELKYGISYYILPVVFGDFISDSIIKNSDGIKDQSINSLINGVLVKYFINGRLNKVIKAVSVYNSQDDIKILNFGKFNMFNNISVPQYIEIEDIKRDIVIKIKIRKIEIPWDGNLEFIPGNRYEIIDLK